MISKCSLSMISNSIGNSCLERSDPSLLKNPKNWS